MGTGADVQVVIRGRGPGWVVVDKPSGLLVHRTALSGDREAMLAHVRDALGQPVYPIHRLDRATSGCLLFGLSPDDVPALQQALADGTKRYLALVRGRADALHGVRIERALTGAEKRGPPREALTSIERIASCAEPRCALLIARPLTGRYHQVRRHLAGRGHPVLGDSSHGDTRVNRTWREQRGLGRLFLHCAALDLPHPDGPIVARAPLPDDLRRVVQALPLWPTALDAAPELLASG